MIDPSIIDAKIAEARARDNAVTQQLLLEIARLPVTAFAQPIGPNGMPAEPVNVQHGRLAGSGLSQGTMRPFPENGSYAYQLYAAICFMVDARVELNLLELIASPHFYSALMRSAAEIEPPK